MRKENIFSYVAILKRLMRYSILCVITTLQLIFAQNPQWIVLDTTNSPLLANSINCVEIDKDNVKWIGTDKGLVKYDGVNWTEYTKTNSPLSGYTVTSIAVDSLTNKWIGTSSDGLNFFNGTTWKLYTTQNSGLPSEIINAIYIDKFNRKFIGTSVGAGAGGFAIFNDITWKVFNTTNADVTSDVVNSFAFDADYNLWVGFGDYFVEGGMNIHGGVAKYDGHQWINYISSDTGLSDYQVNSIFIDKTNKVWIATDNKINTFDGSHWHHYVLLMDSVFYDRTNYITADKNNNIWIGMGRRYLAHKGGALVKYDGENFTVFDPTNTIMPLGYINDIDIDKYNNMWISVHAYWDQSTLKYVGGGLVIYNPDGITSIDNNTHPVPGENYLSQNYPNPFNPTTKIKYTIPNVGASLMKPVRLTVYDVLGKEIATLVNKEKPAGNYEVEFDGSNLSSGVYIYKIQTGDFIQTKKMVLLK